MHAASFDAAAGLRSLMQVGNVRVRVKAVEGDGYSQVCHCYRLAF